MTNGGEYKMLVTIDVGTGRIERVQKVIGVKPEMEGEIVTIGDQSNHPSNPPGGYRYIGTLLAYTGSNCVTLNLPGGGSYTICP